MKQAILTVLATHVPVSPTDNRQKLMVYLNVRRVSDDDQSTTVIRLTREEAEQLAESIGTIMARPSMSDSIDYVEIEDNQ